MRLEAFTVVLEAVADNDPLDSIENDPMEVGDRAADFQEGDPCSEPPNSVELQVERRVHPQCGLHTWSP